MDYFNGPMMCRIRKHCKLGHWDGDIARILAYESQINAKYFGACLFSLYWKTFYRENSCSILMMKFPLVHKYDLLNHLK